LKATKIVATILSLLAISFLVCGSIIATTANFLVYAQSYLQTIKYRNLVIDLGNGLKTNAQLTYPAFGKGPFPGVLLIHSTGSVDMNETLGVIRIDKQTGSKIYPTARPLFQIAQYLSERGFAVLRYDKRGIGANISILDSNVWGNATFNYLKQDAEKALDVLIRQPEVDDNKITLIGHSEGTTIAPRVAVDNPTKVKNIILIGAQAQNIRDAVYFQWVYLPLLYAQNVLDHNHNGSISIQEASKDPIFQAITITPLSPNTVKLLLSGKVVTATQLLQSFKNTNNIKQNYISIDKDLKPLLLKKLASLPAKNASCTIDGCPIWWKSHFDLATTLGMIGNVSSSTGILILQGENDTQTPVQQAFMLQQRLTDVNHPDHTLITYPGLGHDMSPAIGNYPGSSMYGLQKAGPIEDYVLADLYAWLEAHSGLSHPFATTTTTATAATSHTAKMTSFSSNTTSNSSSRSK
jgi:uncharacterized protein